MPLKPLSEPVTDETPARVGEVVLVCKCPDGYYRRVKTDNEGRFVVAGIEGGPGGAVEIANWPATQNVAGSVDIGNWPAGFLAQVTNWPSSQAVTGAFWPATQPVSGTFWQATQPVSIAAPVAVTGTFWQATQPVSLASPVAVTGSFWQATQPVSGPVTDVQLRASPVPVSGTFWQATQPVSAAALPLPAGAATEATLATVAKPSVLAATQTGASGAAVTLTLAAVGGQFHYITHIRIQLYAAAARTGGAAPVVVTSTNLPGSLAYTFETAQAIGTSVERVTELSGNPLKSSAAGVATTIVCPVASGGIWRVTAHYYAAA